MAVKFGNVDKVRSMANFCEIALYLETQPTFWRLNDLTEDHKENNQKEYRHFPAKTGPEAYIRALWI